MTKVCQPYNLLSSDGLQESDRTCGMASAQGNENTSRPQRYDEYIQRKIRHIFEEYINPRNILYKFCKYDVNVLNRQDIENVRAVIDAKGETEGANELLNLLSRYKNWYKCLIQVLQDGDVKLGHVADMMLDEVGLDDDSHQDGEQREEGLDKDAEIRRLKIALGGLLSIIETSNEVAILERSILSVAKCEAHEKLKCMIKNGVNVNRTDDEGKTALMYVAKSGNHECVTLLIRNGADKNMTDNDGCTALIHAVNHGKTECVEILLGDRNINQLYRDDQTLLMLAARSKGDNVLCLLQLLATDADRALRDIDGHTALAHAVLSGNVGCLQALLETGGHEYVNTSNNLEQTPLMLVALSNRDNRQCLQKLLSAGADIDKKDSDGHTALSHAARVGNAGHIQVLLNASCRRHVNICNNHGQTPLMLAARTVGDKIGCLRELLNRGADIYMKDDNDKTALDHAVEAGNKECENILRQKLT